MSQRGSIYRYGLIVKKLQQKPYSTFEEIVSYIEHQLSFLQVDGEFDDMAIGLSIRTFQREVKNIYQLYGIQIEYSRKHKGYVIVDSIHGSSNFDRMMDAFEIFNSLNLAQDISPYILLEKRKSLGLEYLQIILNALKQNKIIKLHYKKFSDQDIRTKELEPYAIKEFRNRWYLIAYERGAAQVKIFAFDRIKDIEVLPSTFVREKEKDVAHLFDEAFGIMTNEFDSELVTLSVSPAQIDYFRTLPLHSSQQIIENKNEILLTVQVRITQDFIMEILSHVQNVKIISPTHLQEKMKITLSNALSQYD